jgi:hypothetical protein
LDPETTTFLETGCALIVGTVADDGMPHAGRAWGLDVVTTGASPTVRVLLDIDDQLTIDHIARGGPVAVTATSVRTLQSMQLKGVAQGLDPARADDAERMERYIDQFFGDIRDTDATDPDVLEAFRPVGPVACLIEVRERFVQTPGPGAGARVP